MWRNDPVDSAYMCPVGITAAAAGFFMFFEGLKREIIVAVVPKDEMDRR
jgi:hypothetical protein